MQNSIPSQIKNSVPSKKSNRLSVTITLKENGMLNANPIKKQKMINLIKAVNAIEIKPSSFYQACMDEDDRYAILWNVSL